MHVFIPRDLRRDLNTIFTFIRIHLGSKGGAVVKGLASYQCGPGLNPEVDATRELSLLLVLSFALRGFSPGAPQKNTPDTSKFQFDLEGADTFQPVLKKCSGVNKLQKILAQQVLCLTLPPLNRKTQRENRSKFQAYPERFRCTDGGVGAKRMEPQKHCLKSWTGRFQGCTRLILFLFKAPLEMFAGKSELCGWDPLYTGLNKYLIGQKLPRIRLSFTRYPQNRTCFWTVNTAAICNRICRVPCKRVARIKNSSVQTYGRTRVNGVMEWGVKAGSDNDDYVSCTVHLILCGLRGAYKSWPYPSQFFLCI